MPLKQLERSTIGSRTPEKGVERVTVERVFVFDFVGSLQAVRKCQ